MRPRCSPNLLKAEGTVNFSQEVWKNSYYLIRSDALFFSDLSKCSSSIHFSLNRPMCIYVYIWIAIYIALLLCSRSKIEVNMCSYLDIMLLRKTCYSLQYILRIFIRSIYWTALNRGSRV